MTPLEKLRAVLYVLVIVAAATIVHEPWMAAIQAALGGFVLGTLFQKNYFGHRP